MLNTATLVAVTKNSTTNWGQVKLYALYVNKAMTGTIKVQDTATVLGTIAASTPAGTYFDFPGGIAFQNLRFVSDNAADDFSAAIGQV